MEKLFNPVAGTTKRYGNQEIQWSDNMTRVKTIYHKENSEDTIVVNHKDNTATHIDGTPYTGKFYNQEPISVMVNDIAYDYFAEKGQYIDGKKDGDWECWGIYSNDKIEPELRSVTHYKDGVEVKKNNKEKDVTLKSERFESGAEPRKESKISKIVNHVKGMFR